MSNPRGQADLAISSLMRETRGKNHQLKPSTKFKFWSNSFDGLRFLYDHPNMIEKVNKVISTMVLGLTPIC